MQRRSIITVAMISAAGVLLGLIGNVATSEVHPQHRYVPWMWAAVIVLALLIIAGAVREVVHAARSSVDTVGNIDLSRVSNQLAASVQHQWQGESERRQLNDPFPLSVHWRAADAALFPEWPVLIRLATVGPGWPPRATEAWAQSPERLTGTGSDLVDVLDRVPTGRLVVLGGAGAGKTILLVRLTLDLLARRTSGGPVPILLPIASWNPAEQDLHSWVERRLILEHGALSSKLGSSQASHARMLINAGLILPVLDGLDEIPDAIRGSAIARINDALRPGQRLVLACRTAAYREAVSPAYGVEVQLAGATGIVLSPLTVEVVGDYLRKSAGGSAAARRWDDFFARFDVDASVPVKQALAIPLTVALIRAVYNSRPGDRQPTETPHPCELLDQERFPKYDSVERYLFDRMIPTAYRPSTDSVQRLEWTAQQAERWLAFLARDLEHRLSGTTDIRWWELPGAAPRPLAGIVTGFIAAIASLLTPAFGIGPGVGLIVGLVVGLVARTRIPDRQRLGMTRLASGLIGGILGGLSGSVVPLALLRPDIGTAGTIAGGGIGVGIVVAPFGNLLVCFIGGFVGEIALVFYERTALFAGVRAALGLSGVHIINAVGLGLAVGLAVGLASRNTPARALRWSRLGFVCGAAAALILGVVIGTQLGLTKGLLVATLLVIPSGFAGSIMFEAAEPDLTTVAAPSTLLKRDRATFRSSFLGLGSALAFGLGLTLGMTPVDGHPAGFHVGVGVGIADFIAGGLAFAFLQASWGSFTLARWWLALSGRLPWRLMTFLADAHLNRGVLRQAGAVYQFRHIELQRRLAARDDVSKRADPIT
jgi:hypothetical protein